MPPKSKVGILTILKVNNYGAELQAFATQKVLLLMGYDAEIIDYLFYKNQRHIATRSSRPVFKMSLKKRLAEYMYPRIAKLKQLMQRNEAGQYRVKNFAEFHKINTKFSREFRSLDDLKEMGTSYDAYIVGSDQVWNPGNYTSLDPYFLKFAPKDKPRISYASSFGLSKLPDYTHLYYKEALNGLSAISVREENAVGLVKEVSGRDATWVLDPTLLLNADEWTSVANEVDKLKDEKYALLYELTPCPYLKVLAKHIAKLKGVKVVRITKDAARCENDDEIINILDAGPAEFLWLFKNAEFVVTNSFHGTAFSINMNKNFYVVTPTRKQNNSRQKSILNLFGLTDRLLQENAPLPEAKFFDIDYALVNVCLEEERIKSKNFLKNAIDGE